MHTRLILFKGLPGSGKSTLSRALGRCLDIPIIDKDDINDVLHEQGAASGGLAYEIMLNVARRQLLQGLSVICDSPLLYRRTYECAQAIAIEAKASIVIVECICSDKQIWQRRIDSRQSLHLPSHRQTDWGSFQPYLNALDEHTSYPMIHPHLIVDTIRPLQECIAEVTTWIEWHTIVVE